MFDPDDVPACEIQRVADYLDEAVWRRATLQYLRILAGRATLQGVDLGGENSPLVQ